MLNRSDRLRLFALLLWALPVAALLPLGLWWLWQNGAMPYWLAAMLAFSAAGYGLQLWLRRRDRRLLADAQTVPTPIGRRTRRPPGTPSRPWPRGSSPRTGR